MKNLSKYSALLMAGAILFSTTVSANNFSGVKEKAVEKARSAVSTASPDDWKTLAKSAESLIIKKTNLGEAKEWLEKSIEINPTSYNLEVMGDYYSLNNLPKKAIGYYIQSMDKLKENNANISTTELQDKILTASKKR